MFRGTACSAQGTSTFNVSVSSGAGGVWSVFEGTWRQFTWTAGTNWLGFVQPKNINSSVNTSTAMHLHSYCGDVAH